MMLCGAALRGVVRACALRHSQMWVSQAGSQSCILREGPVEASRRLAGAARLGEVQVNRCHGHDWWGLIMHAEGSEIDYICSRWSRFLWSRFLPMVTRSYFQATAKARQSISARRQRGAAVQPSQSNCRAAVKLLGGEIASGRTRASCAS